MLPFKLLKIRFGWKYWVNKSTTITIEIFKSCIWKSFPTYLLSLTGLEPLTNTLLSLARKPLFRLFQAQLVISWPLAQSWAWMLYRDSKSEPSSRSSQSISEPKVSPGRPKCNPKADLHFSLIRTQVNFEACASVRKSPGRVWALEALPIMLIQVHQCLYQSRELAEQQALSLLTMTSQRALKQSLS